MLKPRNKIEAEALEMSLKKIKNDIPISCYN